MGVFLNIVNLFVVIIFLSGVNPKSVKNVTKLKETDAENQERIVGGEDAIPNEFPYQIRLLIDDNTLCGGTLISDSTILTAAHCVVHASKVEAIAGDHTLNSVERTEQTRKVERINCHKNYDEETLQNDICVLVVKSKFSTNNAVQPISLPNKSFNITSGSLVVTGWGTTSFEGSLSNVLQKVTVNIDDHFECAQKYLYAVTEKMICASSYGKDSCQGDSGGPAVCKVNGTNYVCGIVSFGHECAVPGYPGVYTKVSAYDTWIQENASTKTNIDVLVLSMAIFLYQLYH